jgi:hypothetical protein
MSKRHDLSGIRFGRLVAITRAEDGKRGTSRWWCTCDCDKNVIISANQLRTGRTRSCGCLRSERDLTSKKMKPEYHIWCGIISRCENAHVKTYHLYGGRGIRIDPEWRADFNAFFRDMGPRPSELHSVDRINANGNYEPENCRWASRLEQANNKRNTRYVMYRDQMLSLCNAIRLAGSVIHYEAAWIRIKSGWTVERAIETPRMFASPNSKERRRQPDLTTVAA